MKNNWQTKRLGEIADFTRGLTYSKSDEVDISDTVVLRANNIDLNTNSLNFSELKYLRDDLIIPEEKKVKEGSLIITTASGSQSHLGKVALIDQSYDYAFGGFMGQLTPKNNIDSKYLFYALTSDNYRKYILELTKGVNINNLKYDQLSNFEFLVPSIQEQKRIVKILDKLSEKTKKLELIYQRKLANLEELKKSILQKAFSGKL